MTIQNASASIVRSGAEASGSVHSDSVRVLRPLLVTRIAYLVSGVALVGFAVYALLASAAPYSLNLAVSLMFVTLCVGAAALFAWISIRGYRLSVELRETSLRIAGFFRTTEIPRAAIRDLHGPKSLPLISWIDPQGRKRVAYAFALVTRFDQLPVFQRHAAECRAVLQSWIDASPSLG